MLAFLLYCNVIGLLGARASQSFKVKPQFGFPSLAVTTSIITLMSRASFCQQSQLVITASKCLKTCRSEKFLL